MNNTFTNLEVWKKAMDLSKDTILYTTQNFTKYHPLAEQLYRSSISIPSNIAEGSERSTKADFSRFLYIAKGSSAELRTQLMLVEYFIPTIDLNIINNLITKAEEISKMLQGLINSLSK